MKKIVIFLKIALYCVFMPCFLYSKPVTNDPRNNPNVKPFQHVCITIPKSGTHLLGKCIKLLLSKDFNHNNNVHNDADNNRKIKKCTYLSRELMRTHQEDAFRERVNQKMRKRMGSFHIIHTAEREFFVKNSAKAGLFMLRDPRDQLISFVSWSCGKEILNSPDFNRILLDLIDGKQRGDIFTIKMNYPCSAMWTSGIGEYYRWYLPWMAVDNVYTVRFENLVGSQGGGSKEAQKAEICNIARHLHIDLAENKLQEIIENLFGGTSTFNKGQISSWKKYFTEEHKQAFKQAAGELLITLGYEKDMSW